MDRSAIEPALPRRALDLVGREIEVTERIIQGMAPGDPRSADYLLRLALNYRERHGYAGDDGDLQASIRTLAQIVQTFPDYRRMDEVLSLLADELDRMRQFDRARQVYFRLIKGYPDSVFVPPAYLGFADYYDREGQAAEASQFYTKVREYPPPANARHLYATYRSAWTLVRLEDFRGALAMFARAREAPAEGQLGADAIHRAALRDMTVPYARIGRVRLAPAFFARYAPDGRQREEALRELWHAYLRVSPSDARELAAAAFVAGAAPLRCGWLTAMREAVACDARAR